MTRRLVKIAVPVILLVLIALLAPLLLLHSLDFGPVRALVLSLVRDATGLDVDYTHASISTTGLVLEGLRVRQPEVCRGYAEDLLAIDRIEVAFNLDELRLEPRRVAKINARGLRATYIDVQEGPPCFPRSSAPEAESPPKPLSRILELQGPGLDLGGFGLEDIAIQRLVVKGGKVVQSESLAGLSLAGAARMAQGELAAELQVAGHPLRVELTEDGRPHMAELDFRTTLKVLDPHHVEATATLAGLRQDLLPDLAAFRDVLDLFARVELSPREGVVRVKFEKFSALDQAASLSAQVAVADNPGAGPLAVVQGLLATLQLDRLPLRSLAQFLPVPPLDLSDVQVSVTADEVGIGGASGLLTSGAIKTSLKAGHIGIEHDGKRFELDGLALDASVPGLSNKSPPSAGTVSLSFDRLAPGDTIAEVRRAKADLSFEDLLLRPDSLPRSTGRARLLVKALGVELSLKLDKGAEDALSFDISGAATRLAPLLPYLPPATRRAIPVDLARMGVRFESSGDVSKLLDPDRSIRFNSHLRATGVSSALKDRRLDLAAIDLTGRGVLSAASVHLAVTTVAMRPTLANKPLADRVAISGDGHVTKNAAKVSVTVNAAGPKGPLLDLTADLHQRAGTLGFKVDLKTGDLSGLASSLLPRRWRTRVGWDGLRLGLSAAGDLAGVLSMRGFVPALAHRPSPRGAQHVELEVKGVRYRASGVEVEAPHVTARLNAKEGPDTRSLDLALTHEDARLAVGGTRVRLLDSAHEVHVRSEGPPEQGRFAAELTSTISQLEKNLVPQYPVGDLKIGVRARVDRGAFRLDALNIENIKGGTKLELLAAMDEAGATAQASDRSPISVPGRQALAAWGVVEQRLDALKFDEGTFNGKGVVRVPFRVESGDASRYRLTASIEASGVDAFVPGLKVAVKNLYGVIPIIEEVVIKDGGFGLAGRPSTGAWAMVRFQDVHPYLATGSHTVADLLKVGPLEFGPIAGNFRVFHDMVALDQMEASWRGGTVTGQLVVDTREQSLSFRGDVTGVRPSSSDGASLQANAALRVSLKTMEASGRVTIVKISRGHLLDLLDVMDPTRSEVSVNRVRKALMLGWPEAVFVRLQDGFLSARISLGGLASMVRIDEIRGIPVPPILRRFLGRFADRRALL